MQEHRQLWGAQAIDAARLLGQKHVHRRTGFDSRESLTLDRALGRSDVYLWVQVFRFPCPHDEAEVEFLGHSMDEAEALLSDCPECGRRYRIEFDADYCGDGKWRDCSALVEVKPDA